MDDVKRYNAYAEELTIHFEVDSEGAWVSAADFDAQRLRADTAEACVEEWRRSNHGKTVLENLELRKKLAAAEQRIDELLVMLRQAWVDLEVSAADCRKIDAALNPQNRGRKS